MFVTVQIDRKPSIRVYLHSNIGFCIDFLPEMEFPLGKDAVFATLKELLITEFMLEPDSISLEKRLDEDLQLDSLDTVDLVVNLRDHTKGEIDPTLFKDAYTVQDMVDLLHPIWKPA